MSDEYPWYGLAKGEPLEQGDILLNCPHDEFLANGSVDRLWTDVVVLSQSCDLIHDKLAVVQVCPLLPLETIALELPHLQNRKGRENLRKGNLPGYHLLNRCSLEGHETDFLVCDFRLVFGVRKPTICSLAGTPHLRLLPPYREHLAQAFARFFMRIGLPADIPPF